LIAVLRRTRWERRGVHVPPYMIASVTGQCTMQCAHCYAKDLPRRQGTEMTSSEWQAVFCQAKELGIGIIFIAGGEPFMRTDVIEVMARFPGTLFPVFTNGMLLKGSMMNMLRRHRHILPVVSLEGPHAYTDARRGDGCFQSVTALMQELHRQGIVFGASLTVTRANFTEVTGEGFVRSLIAQGARALFFVEYVPVSRDTEHLVITAEQRRFLSVIRDTHPAGRDGLLVAFPGNEEIYDGCLAAGRGFIHIAPQGDVEPCPFAPFSDTNVKAMPLRDALRSEFLGKIREKHSLLSEREGGCALWKNREELSLSKK